MLQHNVAKANYQFAFLDIELPGISGLELASLLKKHNPHIPDCSDHQLSPNISILPFAINKLINICSNPFAPSSFLPRCALYSANTVNRISSMWKMSEI